MIGTMFLAVLAATSVAGYAPAPPAATAAVATPRGATLGPGGYATIADAPPAPFTPAPPAGPKPATPEQIAAQKQYNRAIQFQSEVNFEAATLANRLRVTEKDNFVDYYWENEGEPHVVFQFIRDGKETLAKYVRHPRFVAVDVGYSKDELKAALDFMLETFGDERVIAGGGIGGKSGRADVRISVPEEEFRALAAKKGVAIPDAVRLEFPVKTPASAANRPLPPEIARLVRIFPRHDRPLGPVPDTSRIVKPVLRDGCFRLADQDDALVLFPLATQLFIDRDGYLAFGEKEVPGYARVGEKVEFHGVPTEITAPELVAPIHAACGAGKVVMINRPTSAAAVGAQNIVDTNAQAERHFRENYGLPAAVARHAVERCKAVQGHAACLITPPPPPPPGGAKCPAGTKAIHGMCRTPEGFIWPLPKWVEELIADEPR